MSSQTRGDDQTRSGWIAGTVGAVILVAAMIGSVRFLQVPVAPARTVLAPEATAAVEARLQDSAFTRQSRTTLHVYGLSHNGVTQVTAEVSPQSWGYTPHTNHWELTRPRGEALEAFTLMWQALEPNDLYRTVGQVRVVLGIGPVHYAATASTDDLAAFGRGRLTPGEFWVRCVVEQT